MTSFFRLGSSVDRIDGTKLESKMGTQNVKRDGVIFLQAKSDDELSREKAWIDAGRVWLHHRDGFAGASLVKGGAGDEEGRVRVRLDAGGQVLTVDEDELDKANPPQFDQAEDLANLRHLNESSLLHTLRQRYAASLPHTYAGQSLVVINPVAPLAVYSERVSCRHSFTGFDSFLRLRIRAHSGTSSTRFQLDVYLNFFSFLKVVQLH